MICFPMFMCIFDSVIMASSTLIPIVCILQVSGVSFVSLAQAVVVSLVQCILAL